MTEEPLEPQTEVPNEFEQEPTLNDLTPEQLHEIIAQQATFIQQLEGRESGAHDYIEIDLLGVGSFKMQSPTLDANQLAGVVLEFMKKRTFKSSDNHSII